MDINKEKEAFEAYIKSIYPMGEQLAKDCGKTPCELYSSEWETWQAAKAQAVPEGFVLVSAEQLSQWGHMANYAEQYGCPECFEARGYAHSLACEINAYFNVSEAQEPAND